jgi:RND superfamily putative drug exporter
MPGQAFRVDNQTVHIYGNGGSQTPYVPVLTVPAGRQVADPAVAAASGRVFAATALAIPHVRIVDYATTHNRAFITRDGRSTFALVYTAPETGFGGASSGPAIQHALAAAAPSGWHVGVTGPSCWRTASPPPPREPG